MIWNWRCVITVSTEGEAASDAGMAVVLLKREGNEELRDEAIAKYPVIEKFELTTSEAKDEEEVPAKKIKLAEEEVAKKEEEVKDVEMKEDAEDKKVSKKKSLNSSPCQ